MHWGLAHKTIVMCTGGMDDGKGDGDGDDDAAGDGDDEMPMMVMMARFGA